MENRKFIKFLIPAILLGFFILRVPSTQAYGIETHAYLTSEIIDFYNQSYSGNQVPDELKSYLIDGSRKEDETPRWLNHFYDPVYDRGLNTSYGVKGYRSKTWAQDADKQNEVRFRVTHFIGSLLSAAEQRKISEVSADANFTWNRAIEFYVQGEKEKAMFALGHVLHLIEDTGVPDHTRNDDHPTGSPYEDFAKKFSLSNPDSELTSRASRKGPVMLNNLDGYFNNLATYSNNNFYSLNTIGIQSGYNLPEPDYIEKDGRYFYGFNRDEEGSEYRLFIKKSQGLLDTVASSQGNIVLVVDDEGGDLALHDYWSRLSPKVVQHGAGVINLFFQEAEKAKDDPKFAKKEEKGFFSKIIDSAKAAVSQIFNKTSNKPAAVIDLSKQNQQKPVTNLTASVVQIRGQAVSQPSVQKTSPQKVALKQEQAPKTQDRKKEEVKQEKVVKQSVQECSFNIGQQPSHHEIVINEVAWMGGPSAAGLGASDEWIELKNLTAKPINISGWQVVDRDENIQAVFKDGAKIPASGFYLLERTNDNSVPGITADAIYTGALANNNEGLRLFASDCNLIDEVLASPNWPAGDNSSRRTMQRDRSLGWSTYGGGATNGVLGTPKSENGLPFAVEQNISSQSVASTNSASTSSGSGGGSSGSGGSSSQSSAPTQANVLITEVQITGGSGKTNYDFVEIFNPTDAPVNLNGHRLVKRTKTGASDTTIKSWTSDTIIPAQSYYLWANNDYTEISATPDVTTSGTISNDNGVAVRFGAENTGTIVDSVAWGEAANIFVEGAVFATNPGANEGIHRKTGSGYVDTGNNADDFELKTCLTPKAPTCAPPNQAPTALLDFSPASPTTADTVNFTGASSSDSDGSISYYAWDFGDGTLSSSTSSTATYAYPTTGSYIVSLIVFDDRNASSTASTTVNVAAPTPPPPAVLFEQSDSSGGILLAGGRFFSLGNGADGSANQLKIKFKPDNVTTDNRFYVAPWRIKENGGAESGFWYSGNEEKASQPKYCFTTAETDAWKEIVFTFANPLNFLASKTYDLYLLFLRDQNEKVCANDEYVGTGNNVQGTWAADAANSLIYFQIGNGL